MSIHGGAPDHLFSHDLPARKYNIVSSFSDDHKAEDFSTYDEAACKVHHGEWHAAQGDKKAHCTAPKPKAAH